MYLKNSKIIVVKIGSSLLVDNERKIRKKWLSTFARDIKRLRSKNKKVIIVSSGATFYRIVDGTILVQPGISSAI